MISQYAAAAVELVALFPRKPFPGNNGAEETVEAKKITAITELVDSFIAEIRCVISLVFYTKKKGCRPKRQEEGNYVRGAQLRMSE